MRKSLLFYWCDSLVFIFFHTLCLHHTVYNLILLNLWALTWHLSVCICFVYFYLFFCFVVFFFFVCSADMFFINSVWPLPTKCSFSRWLLQSNSNISPYRTLRFIVAKHFVYFPKNGMIIILAFHTHTQVQATASIAGYVGVLESTY